jgi:hypothetical protein
LIRLNPENGKIFWQTRCNGLGVMHSAYQQDVTMTLESNSITVKSVASGGTFVESLALDSGKQISRK